MQCADATLPTVAPRIDRPRVLQAHCGRSATVELAEANAWRNFGVEQRSSRAAQALHNVCSKIVDGDHSRTARVKWFEDEWGTLESATARQQRRAELLAQLTDQART